MDPAKTESDAKRAALYGRVSTKDKGQEIENQLAELRRFAASQGWEIQGEYIDHERGKNSARPQFRRLFADAAQRGFDVVLFWSLDRLTREGALETLQHLNTLSSYGVGFRSFTEPYLDSCGIFKDAIIAILGTIAKQERVRISERVRAGLNRAKEKGIKLGRPRKIVDRLEVVRLRDEERLSWPEIARRTGCGQGTVVRAYRSYKSTT
jgi:DNA invertase Pin-like site-specific DNA recombinase